MCSIKFGAYTQMLIGNLRTGFVPPPVYFVIVNVNHYKYNIYLHMLFDTKKSKKKNLIVKQTLLEELKVMKNWTQPKKKEKQKRITTLLQQTFLILLLYLRKPSYYEL